jgi:hypothetical protein
VIIAKALLLFVLTVREGSSLIVGMVRLSVI